MERPAREIPVVQGTSDWRTLRSGFISPSRFRTVVAGTVQGLNSYLAEIRAGRGAGESFTGAACAWGKYHEPLARAQYELVTGRFARVAGFFVHSALARVGGSPDFIVEPNGGGEIKCPYNPEVHQRTLKFGCPAEHLYQINGYMWLLGAKWWDFVSFNPREKNIDDRLYIQRIERDEAAMRRIDRRVRWFHEILITGRSVKEVLAEDVVLASAPLPRFF